MKNFYKENLRQIRSRKRIRGVFQIIFFKYKIRSRESHCNGKVRVIQDVLLNGRVSALQNGIETLILRNM